MKDRNKNLEELQKNYIPALATVDMIASLKKFKSESLTKDVIENILDEKEMEFIALRADMLTLIENLFRLEYKDLIVNFISSYLEYFISIGYQYGQEDRLLKKMLEE